MAKVVKARGKWCVAHGRTGHPIKRKGRIVCFTSKKAAQAEARSTQHRVVGK